MSGEAYDLFYALCAFVEKTFQPVPLTARGEFWRDMLAAARYERDRRDREGWRDGHTTPRINAPVPLTGPVPAWMRSPKETA